MDNIAPILLLGLLLALIVGGVGWLIASHRVLPAERERRRRLLLSATGRMIDAEVTEVEGGELHYAYEVGGVVYNASQDVSALAVYLPGDPVLAIGPATVKYLPRNPANSIVICEDWSGLRSRRRIPFEDRKGA